MRLEALALRAERPRGPTAVLTHGANPGLVSHMVKQALLNIAADTGVAVQAPTGREDWARLAQALGIKVIHVAERDTQVTNVPKKPNEFVNTWSVDGFVSEGAQPAELGWGTHERNFPRDGGRHDFGSGCGDLPEPPGRQHARAHLDPAGRPFPWLSDHAFRGHLDPRLLHGARRRAGAFTGRPCHYAYHPCDDAVMSVHEFAGRNWHAPGAQAHHAGRDHGGHRRARRAARRAQEERLLVRLAAVDRARRGALAPYNSATSLQVTIAVLSGMIWAMENPNRGIVEPDEIDFRRSLDICMPYLGQGRRRVHRLDAALRTRAAVPRGHRQERSVAVQERAGDLSGRPRVARSRPRS